MKTPEKAEYSNKSGLDAVTDYVKVHGGLPPKKSVDEIEKVNRPKNNKDSVAAS